MNSPEAGYPSRETTAQGGRAATIINDPDSALEKRRLMRPRMNFIGAGYPSSSRKKSQSNSVSKSQSLSTAVQRLSKLSRYPRSAGNGKLRKKKVHPPAFGSLELTAAGGRGPACRDCSRQVRSPTSR